MCDRVAVMYLGKIVELADSEALYAHPRMPYTGALMSAVPVADPELATTKKRQLLTGDVPSPTNPPSGCRFHTRCWKAQEICRVEDPPLTPKDGGNIAACHFPLTDQEVAERVPTAPAGVDPGAAPGDDRRVPPAARVGDMHTCPLSDGPKPHVGGPILPPGAPTVLIAGMPAARVGDMCTCVGPPDTIAMGSTKVMIGGCRPRGWAIRPPTAA